MAKKRGFPVPEHFVVTPEMFKWAAQQGLDEHTVARETEKFLDRNRAKGELYVDWRAAWRNWLRNVIEYQRQKGSAFTTSVYISQPRKRLN